ncbi:MAG: metal-dependent hydrolase [Bacteroidia bacterium]|nr:metal-dependent hydrolase [Bacteroidia bacterium]
MASVFSHAVAGIALGKVLEGKASNLKFWLLGVFCTIFPDADVIFFQFGVKYEDFWGHRGFMHSMVFALLMALLLKFIFYPRVKWNSRYGLMLGLYFFLCMTSHGLLDMLTTGGKGVAILAPFDNTRYFFPWRVIRVSPIGIKNFFGEWGLTVLKSEFIWVWIPSALIYGIAWLRRNSRKKLDKTAPNQ